MEQIIRVEQTKNTPSIYIDKNLNLCRIEGSSFPEDASETYVPVFKWLEELADKVVENLKFEFDFDFLNSISHKKVWIILNELHKFYEKGSNVKIIWYHDKYDEEIMEAGEDLSEFVDVPFEVYAK